MYMVWGRLRVHQANHVRFLSMWDFFLMGTVALYRVGSTGLRSGVWHPIIWVTQLVHITVMSRMNLFIWTSRATPPEKLLGDGFSTPMPLFSLICTTFSNRTCLLDLHQRTNFEWAGVDTSGRVRHPPYSKRLFVRIWVARLVLQQVDRKNPHPPGEFPISSVPSSRPVCKRTPLEEPDKNPSRGFLLHTVLDEGT